MTGYGKAVAEFGEKKIHVEIKSLNSKTLDVSTRIASLYREKEMEIRQQIQQKVIRGKVDFSLWVEKNASQEATPINGEMVRYYYDQINRIAYEQEMNLAPVEWATILRLPDVMTKQDNEELTDEEWAAASNAVGDAIADLISFRRQEGEALEKKFNEKIDNIESLMNAITPYEQSRVEKIRTRLMENLSTIKEVNYDKNRLEQELIYYIEKLDISEERQRLTNHLKYFRETMADQDGGQGKKLSFIAQEMGREINTTGSKSNQAEMQNIVVQMKDELEQIKEQVLNAL